jgi:hypothetical protein
VVDSKGLASVQLGELIKSINGRTRDLLGTEMIFELASLTQEYLSDVSSRVHLAGTPLDSNAAEHSVYDQMKLRHFEENQVNLQSSAANSKV